MQKVLIYLLLLIFPANSISTGSALSVAPPAPVLSDSRQLYLDMQLEEVVNYDAFQQALAGYQRIDRKNKEILTLIDFSKPSTEERFYVLDIQQRKLLFSSLVSHGRNSGEKYATSFSNEQGSYKSSLGFYITENTYQGKNGYSLVLDGLEKDINDRAKERAIVIHGAAYSNPTAIASGRLGRSFGCPALPQAVNQSVINTIKDGSIVFIYANSKEYLSRSPILSTPEEPFVCYDGKQGRQV